MPKENIGIIKNCIKKLLALIAFFWINETDEIGKMKRAIETGKEYDLGKDPDYADISGIVI